MLVHSMNYYLQRTSRLPVVYVFGRKPLDMDLGIELIGSFFRTIEMDNDVHSEIRVRHDVSYSYLASEFFP